MNPTDIEKTKTTGRVLEEVKSGKLFTNLKQAWYDVVTTILEPEIKNYPTVDDAKTEESLMNYIKAMHKLTEKISQKISEYAMNKDIPVELAFCLQLMAINLVFPTDYADDEIPERISQLTGGKAHPLSTNLTLVYTSWRARNIINSTDEKQAMVITKALKSMLNNTYVESNKDTVH